MPTEKKARKPRVVRTVEERLAAAEALSRALKVRVAAGDNENVQALVRASRALQQVRTLGKKDVDAAVSVAKEAVQKALAGLGF